MPRKSNCTLKVALLVGDEVKNVTTRKYTISGVDDPTSVSQPTVSGESDVKVYSSNGRLVIESNTRKVIPVYTASGVLVKELKVENGFNYFESIQPGLYIVLGKKVIVR